MDKAALSRAVDGLVNLGMLTRRENPEDRRAVIIGPTPAGLAKIKEVNEGADESYRKLFSLIPADQQATVVCAINHLAKAYDALDTPPCACGKEKE